MNYTLIIQSPPYGVTSSEHALKFAKCLLEKKHVIKRIFFYGDGVYNATQLTITPQNESDLSSAWRTFISSNNLDNVVCIAAALRRGVINETEAKRYEKEAVNMHENFELSGLGQLIDASTQSDRVITFS